MLCWFVKVEGEAVLFMGSEFVPFLCGLWLFDCREYEERRRGSEDSVSRNRGRYMECEEG